MNFCKPKAFFTYTVTMLSIDELIEAATFKWLFIILINKFIHVSVLYFVFTDQEFSFLSDSFLIFFAAASNENSQWRKHLPKPQLS